MYKLEIYPDKAGHVQRNNKTKELEFTRLSKLKVWIKDKCDLRHNVLTKAEYLANEIEDLTKKGETEFKLSISAIVIVTNKN